MARIRREHPLPLPGIAHIRITASDDATRDKILNILRAHFTITEPSAYSGGRAYLDCDTRPGTPPYPEG